MYEIFEKLCKSRNITPYRFCKDTGVNSSTISTWKKKNSLASPELAQKVCDYFGITYDYLMTGKETVGSCEYDISNLKKHTENEQALLENFSKLNFKGEEEAIKRVRELVFVPEYTENQEELWQLIPGSCKTVEKPTDWDSQFEDDDSCDTTIRTVHTTFSLSDLIDTGNNSSSSLAAARNDHINEDGEMEKVKSDLAKLKKPNRK